MDYTTHATWTCSTNTEWSTTTVGSKGSTYSVSYGRTWNGPYQYDWSCTCRGFKFRGSCKHITQVRDSGDRCAWNETLDVGAEAGTDAGGNPCCPECSGPVQAFNVAV